jgi:U5 small nuclear ribonucleoprotein component
VQFILEPFYKLISVSISEEKIELERILKKEQIVLKKAEFDLDIKPLIKLIFSKFLGDLSCLVDCLAALPNAKIGTLNKVKLTYPGD